MRESKMVRGHSDSHQSSEVVSLRRLSGREYTFEVVGDRILRVRQMNELPYQS